MAILENLTTNTIGIFASRNDLNGDAPFRGSLASLSTLTVPDKVARLPEIKGLVDSATIQINSWDTTDGSGIGQAEIKKLMSIGTGTLANASTTVVADTRIKTSSKVFIIGLDTAFAALDVWHDAASLVDGTSFTLDHAAAGGTETFDYLIVDPTHI